VLLAASVASLPHPIRPLLLASLLVVQADSMTGLMTRPEPTQPEPAARAAFRTAASNRLHILLVEPQSELASLHAALADWPEVTAAKIGVDRDRTRALRLLNDALKGDRQMR
jgi:hypothetical protein